MNIKRNRFIGIAIGVTMIISLLVTSGIAQDKPFAGTELIFGCQGNSVSDAMKPLLPIFEEETGIKVSLEQMSGSALLDRIMIESAGRTGAFDIMYGSPSFIGMLVDGGLIVPVDEYIEKYNVDLSVFSEATLKGHSTYAPYDEIWGLPYLTSIEMFMYRKDLFEDPNEKAAFKAEYGYELAPPTSTSMHEDIARFFTRDTDGDGEIDMYGAGYRQGGEQQAWSFLFTQTLTHGLEYIYNEDTFEPTFNRPEAIDAFKWAKRMTKNYMPPEVLTWTSSSKMVSSFKEGRQATVRLWFGSAISLLDPEKNPEYEKVGIVPFYGTSMLGGGSMVIHRDSKNHEAAFLFTKWLNEYENQKLWYMNGGGITVTALFEDEDILNKFPIMRVVFPAYREAVAEHSRSRPKIKEIWAITKAIYTHYIDYLFGEQTAEEAVAKVDEAIGDTFRLTGRWGG